MSDENQGAPAGAAPGANPTADPAKAPSLNIVGQYIKDLSFENPGAPASILANAAQPQISIGVSVAAKKQADNVYASEITINVKAEREKTLLFSVELVYGGIFRMSNMNDTQIYQVAMVECPRMLFPFARQVLSNVTQAGGFPPVLMEPIDFGALLLQNLKAQQAAKAASGDQQTAPDAGSETPTVN